MAILLIGKHERRQIASAIKRARAKPTPLSTVSKGTVDDGVLTLEQRKKLPQSAIVPRSQFVYFPGGYRAALSFEEQPIGLCAHLSVSVEGRAKPGMLPSPEAVKFIAEEFGVSYPAEKMWTEEYDPGEYAINLVSLVAEAGNA